MEKQKIEILATGVLVVLFIAFLSSTITKRAKKKSVETVQRKETTITESEKHLTGKPLITEVLEWGRDPFVKAQEGTVRKGEFRLSAIVWDTELPYAVINGKVVCAGDKINGCTVLKIDKDKAVVKKDGEKMILELYK